jgi:hypothetical protein
MEHLNPEPKFYSEEFRLVTRIFFLRIGGRDAVHEVFFKFICVFRIVSVDLGPLNLASLHSTHLVELCVHSSV